MKHNREPLHSRERVWTIAVLNTPEEFTPELAEKFRMCSEGIFTISAKERIEFLKEKILDGGKLYYALDADGAVVGYGASESIVWNEKVPEVDRGKLGFYFSNAVVKKENQRQGVYSEINRARIKDALDRKAAYIYFSTQDPNVEVAVRKTLEEFTAGRKSVLKGFTVVHGTYDTFDKLPTTLEKPSPSGIKEIDEKYGALDYEHGETLVPKFRLVYR